jgi:hypothetical protein
VLFVIVTYYGTKNQPRYLQYEGERRTYANGAARKLVRGGAAADIYARTRSDDHLRRQPHLVRDLAAGVRSASIIAADACNGIGKEDRDEGAEGEEIKAHGA